MYFAGFSFKPAICAVGISCLNNLNLNLNLNLNYCAINVIIQCAPILVMFGLIACGSMGLGTMSEFAPALNEHIY